MSASTIERLTTDLRPGLAALSGREADLQAIAQRQRIAFRDRSNLNLSQIQSGFACALHMHQPTIPAGPNGSLICNLQHMYENQGEGDNHNAEPFSWCYKRIGEFIPQLVNDGCNPRIMLDYSGNLLWGLQQMNRHDVLDSLRGVTTDPTYQPYVEWLGTMWSHAVAPSTPIPDLKLHMIAWQQHFAAIFGDEALARVKGFSPPEMHLPNHPDTLYEYIKALKECGYQWLLVQEHSVESPEGHDLPYEQKYVPNRLVARNSHGQEISITALIKTQGSDTKLVAQMQPYHEAKTYGRRSCGSIEVPSLVSQIADGENGGVMMNEFPSGFMQAWGDLKNNPSVAGFNGTEYLELIEAAGADPAAYPVCQAVQQHKIWQRVDPNGATPEAVEAAIAELKQTDYRFHMDGASWTDNLSWVSGYDNVLEPMNDLSAKFHQKFDPLVAADASVTASREYQEALLYNLLLQTSCFRYWGQGTWTDYARTIYEQGKAAIARA